jgi:lipopolysaccharide export system protein LptA
VTSNQASRSDAARAHRRARRRARNAASVLNVLGALALALSLSATAPRWARAQNAPPAGLGASIRKPPSVAQSGGAPAAADSAAATATPAPPAGVGGDADSAASAGTASNAASSASAASTGAVSSSDSAGAAATTPATTESAAPAVPATPAPRRSAKARAAYRAHSGGATASATENHDSKDSKDGKGQEGPFSSLQFSGNKGPINIKSDTLDLDYKGNVVVFRGHVHAVQADAILTSDTLTVTYLKDFREVKDMVANGNVRMSQGTRFATGDHGVLDQAKHTVTLTGNPVVHDGDDEVSGTKITVHLDTGKSQVEGARAVFFPKEQKTRDNKRAAANPS